MKFSNNVSSLQQKLSASSAGINRRQSILNSLDVKTGDTILDIGCGGGHLLEELSLCTGASGKVIGIDPSESQLLSAKERCKNLRNVSFIQCYADKIDLPNNSCDAITSIQTLEYIEDIDTVLKEIKRLQSSNSKFANVSTLWDFYRFYGPEKKLNDLIHEVFKDHCFHQMLPTQLNGKLENLGFTNIKTKELSFVITKRNSNSFATFAETFLANFAISKGVSKEKVLKWREQLKRAEKKGYFCFTNFPVLTEAIIK